MPCRFCEFIAGKVVGGGPFIPLYQTKRTVSFLSIDSPAHEEGHLLVIPKKHYGALAELPAAVRSELFAHAALAVRVLRKRHAGCNVLLNDGRAAGQYVRHVHVHVIPRDEGDNIKIEQWKGKKLTKKKFEEISKRLKKKLSERS